MSCEKVKAARKTSCDTRALKSPTYEDLDILGHTAAISCETLT